MVTAINLPSLALEYHKIAKIQRKDFLLFQAVYENVVCLMRKNHMKIIKIHFNFI